MNRGRSLPITTSAEVMEPAPLRTNLGLLAMVMIWALNYSVVKVALDGLEPLAFNALRFPLASLMVLWLLRQRGPIPRLHRGDRWKMIALGLLGNVVYQLLFIFGIDRTRAGNAALLLATTPILTAVLSSALGHERIGTRVWGGVGATIAGMALIVLADPDGIELSFQSLAGDFILVGASLAWAAYTVGARGLISRYGPIPVTAWTLWIGTPVVVLIGIPGLAVVDWTTFSPLTGFAVAYAGMLGIGLAYILWYQGVRCIGNTRTAVYSNLEPVLALLIAWAWLGEVPGPWQVLGASVIIGGIALARR